MVIKVYISGTSGNKEVKKRQQRVIMILDGKNIKYDLIDIAEPGKESEKEFMLDNAKVKDAKPVLPPQIFNDDNYLGDYEDFDIANELDELDSFFKSSRIPDDNVSVENGNAASATISNGSVPVTKNDVSNDLTNGSKQEESTNHVEQ